MIIGARFQALYFIIFTHLITSYSFLKMISKIISLYLKNFFLRWDTLCLKRMVIHYCLFFHFVWRESMNKTLIVLDWLPKYQSHIFGDESFRLDCCFFIDYSHGKSELLIDYNSIVNNHYFHSLWKMVQRSGEGYNSRAVMCCCDCDEIHCDEITCQSLFFSHVNIVLSF